MEIVSEMYVFCNRAKICAMGAKPTRKMFSLFVNYSVGPEAHSVPVFKKVLIKCKRNITQAEFFIFIKNYSAQ